MIKIIHSSIVAKSKQSARDQIIIAPTVAIQLFGCSYTA